MQIKASKLTDKNKMIDYTFNNVRALETSTLNLKKAKDSNALELAIVFYDKNPICFKCNRILIIDYS